MQRSSDLRLDNVAHICSEAELSSNTSADVMQVVAVPLMHSRSLGVDQPSNENLMGGPNFPGGAGLLCDQHLLAQCCPQDGATGPGAS